jgi:hypothetical protein
MQSRCLSIPWRSLYRSYQYIASTDELCSPLASYGMTRRQREERVLISFPGKEVYFCCYTEEFIREYMSLI